MSVPALYPDVELERVALLGNGILSQVREVRQTDPIFWNEARQVWMVTGHAEVLEGLRGKLPLTVTRMQVLALASIPEDERAARIPYTMTTIPHWMVNVDGPAHARLRVLMMKAFSRQVAEGERPFIRAVIQEALDVVADRPRVEMVEEVARRITGRVILRLMGLPEEVFPRLGPWSKAINAALAGQSAPPAALDHLETTLLEMRAFFEPQIRARRLAPGHDFLSMLVTATDDGDALTDEEILANCYLIIVAGHDTTMNTMVLGTVALAEHPEAQAAMRDNPPNYPDMVLELMRYIAMSFMTARVATRNFNWHGHEIKSGQVLFIAMAGANRDPRAFDDPERLDLSRPQHKNVTFGPGMHHCIGHFLAKVQAGEYFAALVEKFVPVILDDRLNFGGSFGFRGLESLHVRFERRAG